MDAIISHAYGFSGIMLIILITYAAIYFLKISGKKRAEHVKPAEHTVTSVKCEEPSKRGRNAGRAIRYTLLALNLAAHFALIVFILYIDAGMEALLISLLASAAVALVTGGGI